MDGVYSTNHDPVERAMDEVNRLFAQMSDIDRGRFQSRLESWLNWEEDDDDWDSELE